MQETVGVAQGKQCGLNICRTAIVINTDDFADIIGAAAGGLPGGGSSTVFFAIIQQVNCIPIGISNFCQIAVIEFFYIVIFVLQGEGGAAYRQRQVQAILIFVGTAFPGLEEIVLTAVSIMIDIVFITDILCFDRNQPNGLPNGKFPPRAGTHPRIVYGMNAG